MQELSALPGVLPADLAAVFKDSYVFPSIGILLCCGKDDVVVEYAMSRSLIPALVAEYGLVLPSRQLLHDKWQELLMLAEGGGVER